MSLCVLDQKEECGNSFYCAMNLSTFMMARLCCVNKSERDLNYKHFNNSFCGLATSWFFLQAALRGFLVNLKNVGPMAQTKTTFKWQSLVHWYVIMTNCSRQKRYSVSSSLQPEIVSDSVSRSRSYCKSNWPTCQLQVDWELASFPRRLGSSSCSQEHRHLSFATVTLYTKICVLIISVPSQGYILWWHWDL